MRFFIDTEFIPETLELISIGVVAEDGREYYAQNLDIDLSHAGPWVRQYVIPSLERMDAVVAGNPFWTDASRHQHTPWRRHREIGAEIVAFCDPEGQTPPEFWGWCCGFDYVLVSRLFGGMESWPVGWPFYFRDIQQAADDRGIDLGMCGEQPAGNHHACADARWLRHLWGEVQKARGRYD